MMIPMNTLVLLSGGMDSTIGLYDALYDRTDGDGKVHALTFDYGQRHRNETRAAYSIVDQVRRHPTHSKVFGQHIMATIPYGTLPPVGSLLGDQPVRLYGQGNDDTGEDPAFIPHRNLLFLTIAAMWAHQLDARRIVTGLRGGFPDCTEGFERNVARMLQHSVPGTNITIYSPVHKTRTFSIKLAQHIPGCMDAIGFSLTCFNGTEPPCGRCLPCTKRAEGFAKCGVDDPLLVRLGVQGRGDAS